MPAPSAITLLHQAFALDANGHEAQAIPLYRRAIAAGLSKKDLRDALICLGSSLRTVGQTQPAIRTLQKARTLYPRDPAIILFLALAHYDAHQPDLALRQLADALLKESPHPGLAPYRSVLGKKFHAVRRSRTPRNPTR
jgi:tetratricopeptide (TPR) repeat protein